MEANNNNNNNIYNNNADIPVKPPQPPYYHAPNPPYPLSTANNNNNNNMYKRPNPTELPRQPSKRARPTEFVISEDTRKHAPELYDAYIKAQQLDKELEYFILKKRVDLIDVAKNLPKIRHPLRIYLSNVFVTNEEGEVTSWILKIQGHLVDNPQLDALIPFTTFFHKIAVHLDPAVYSTNNVIEWDRPKDQTNVDARGIELVRVGAMESRVKIILEIEHGAHSHYRVADALAMVLRVEMGTRAFVVGKFWEYIKCHKLQDPLDKKQIILNDPLKAIFDCDTMLISTISARLAPFLLLSDEFRLDFFLSKNFRDHKHEYVYDVQVPIPAQFALAINSFITATSDPPRVVAELDAQIAEASYRINEHVRKIDFMGQLTANPALFLRRLIESQNNDVAVLKRATGRDVERERRAEYYSTNTNNNNNSAVDVVEGVARYLDNCQKMVFVPAYNEQTHHFATSAIDYVAKQ